MESKEIKKNAGVPVNDGDGLFLTGLVVSVETIEREWEGEKWRQRNVMVANGKRSYRYTLDDKKETMPDVEAFRRIRVDVEYASTDKGMLNVRGNFQYE